MSNPTTYKDSGVDVQKGDEFVDIIKSLLPRGGHKIGLFGSIFDPKEHNFKDPIFVSGTDGVGTKLKIAKALDKHDTIGIDLVAMCVNDILCHGAKPLFFLDYYGTSKLDLFISTEVIKGIIKGCELSGCELSGGETAEMPGIYHGKDYDLAGFAVGAVEREYLMPKFNNIKHGDVIVALPSSGVHSNGFSLINKLIELGSIKLTDTLNNGQSVGEALIEPTKIYVNEIHELLHKQYPLSFNIHALAHITGGGLYANIVRVIPDGFDVKIDFSAIRTPEIFSYLSTKGNIATEEMQNVFNLGVGMVLICSYKDFSKIHTINKSCYIIGEVIESK